MDVIEKSLVKIEKHIVQLFNEKKIADILKYFEKIFVGFSSTKHDRITSLSQLKSTFNYYLNEGDEVKFSIKNVKVNIYGDSALTSFYWNVDIKKGKKITSVECRGSHIYLLFDDHWRIVHEHFSKIH